MRHPQRLPPRGHAHAEERPAGHGTLRRGLRQGDAPWRHDIRLHAQLLQQGPLRQRPRGGECRQRCGAGDELLPLRRALRRPGGSGGRLPAAVQVQRQGAGDDDEYDFGARWMDPTVGARFTTMDPLCEKYYSISPYAYCHGDPLNFIDPDGRDLILHGDSTNISNSLEQIQNGAGEGISIYYSDADSNLKYQISDGYDTSLLSEQAKLLIKIIDNHNIIVNINAISRNELGDGRWFVAGGFLGNEVMDNGTIIANQVINPRQLAIMDEAGSPGQNIFHEISESYNGAELRLQGVDSSNLYNAAHKTAMPQTELKGGFFNFTGNYSDTFIPISNSYKYFVQTQQGIKVLYNIDLLIKKY